MKLFGRLRLRTEEDGLISTPFKVALTMIIGAFLSLIAVATVDYVFRDDLRLRAKTMAAAIDVDQVRSISGRTVTTTQEVDYQKLKIKLAQLKIVNPEAQYIYLIGQDRVGSYILADSESPDSEDYTEQGTRRPQTSLATIELFDNLSTHVETARKDRGNTWLSTFAPVIDYVEGEVVAIAGIDVPATTYFSLLTLSGLVPIILALATSIIVVYYDRNRARRLEALRFRSELVSIASHELRTPLTGIRWSEEALLHDKSINNKQRASLNSMYESTLKLQESIEDVLQLASLQSKKANQLQKTPSDITRLVRDIFSMQKLPAEQQGTTLRLADDWPNDLVINCDSVRIKRVFNNVISNAIKYTRPHTEVVVGYEKIDNRHVITIRDQGIGIPESEQDKVFSGFYRASNAVEQTSTGTGMGLYLSQAVIMQHEGKMWLHSKVNEGTTVYIQLP